MFINKFLLLLKLVNLYILGFNNNGYQIRLLVEALPLQRRLQLLF